MRKVTLHENQYILYIIFTIKQNNINIVNSDNLQQK